MSAAAYLFGLHPEKMNHPMILMASSYFPLIAPAFVYGVLVGLTGRTPGKLIMFLKVVNRAGRTIGVAQGLLREVVKIISLGFFFFGAIWALYGMVTTGRTFYDEWLGIDADDLKPAGLTPTQKKWREFQPSINT